MVFTHTSLVIHLRKQKMSWEFYIYGRCTSWTKMWINMHTYMEALNYKLSHKPNGILIFVIFWLTLSRFPFPVHEMSQALQGVVQMMRQTSDDFSPPSHQVGYSPQHVSPPTKLHWAPLYHVPFRTDWRLTGPSVVTLTVLAGRVGGSCFFHRMATFGEAPKCHGTDMQRPGASPKIHELPLVNKSIFSVQHWHLKKITESWHIIDVFQVFLNIQFETSPRAVLSLSHCSGTANLDCLTWLMGETKPNAWSARLHPENSWNGAQNWVVSWIFFRIVIFGGMFRFFFAIPFCPWCWCL